MTRRHPPLVRFLNCSCLVLGLLLAKDDGGCQADSGDPSEGCQETTNPECAP